MFQQHIQEIIINLKFTYQCLLVVDDLLSFKLELTAILGGLRGSLTSELCYEQIPFA